MAVAGRFDLEEARREAQAAKRAARIRSIVSNVTLVVVLLAVAIGGKIGWDKWQENREADRAAAEAAQIAEEKARAEQQRAADAKAKALAEKREAERKALEEKREAERKAREREKREREEARVREEERRHAEAEFRAAQQELKKFEDAKVSMLDFRPETYVCFEYGLEKAAKISVDESKWGTLAAHSERRRTAEFLEMLRDDSVTNVISDTCYPDRATFDHLLDNLAAERFTLVLHLAEEWRDRRLALVSTDIEKGLAAPEGLRPIKAGGKVAGWTVPFAYGDKTPFFLLEQATADRFAREWAQFRRKVRIDAAKLDNKDQFVAEKLEKELPEFARTVRIEVTSVPVETTKKDDAKKKDAKKRSLMRGSNSDMRRMNGPQRR